MYKLNKMLIFCGISGSGKTTLIKKLGFNEPLINDELSRTIYGVKYNENITGFNNGGIHSYFTDSFVIEQIKTLAILRRMNLGKLICLESPMLSTNEIAKYCKLAQIYNYEVDIIFLKNDVALSMQRKELRKYDASQLGIVDQTSLTRIKEGIELRKKELSQLLTNNPKLNDTLKIYDYDETKEQVWYEEVKQLLTPTTIKLNSQQFIFHNERYDEVHILSNPNLVKFNPNHLYVFNTPYFKKQTDLLTQCKAFLSEEEFSNKIYIMNDFDWLNVYMPLVKVLTYISDFKFSESIGNDLRAVFQQIATSKFYIEFSALLTIISNPNYYLNYQNLLKIKKELNSQLKQVPSISQEYNELVRKFNQINNNIKAIENNPQQIAIIDYINEHHLYDKEQLNAVVKELMLVKDLMSAKYEISLKIEHLKPLMLPNQQSTLKPIIISYLGLDNTNFNNAVSDLFVFNLSVTEVEEFKKSYYITKAIDHEFYQIITNDNDISLKINNDQLILDQMVKIAEINLAQTLGIMVNNKTNYCPIKLKLFDVLNLEDVGV